MKKLFVLSETEIIRFEQESITSVSGITDNGKDGDEDNASGWKNFGA